MPQFHCSEVSALMRNKYAETVYKELTCEKKSHLKSASVCTVM